MIAMLTRGNITSTLVLLFIRPALPKVKINLTVVLFYISMIAKDIEHFWSVYWLFVFYGELICLIHLPVSWLYYFCICILIDYILSFEFIMYSFPSLLFLSFSCEHLVLFSGLLKPFQKFFTYPCVLNCVPFVFSNSFKVSSMIVEVFDTF